MPKRIVDLRTERPCLDIASLGRRGPEAKLAPSEVASIARTARRVPEVMIKVSGGARTLQGVGAHFDYIGREGLNEIETDMGERLMEREFEQDLMLDWDLDLDVLRRHTDRTVARGRKPPKLVHNLIFSMPKGTPSDKLAAAVRFASGGNGSRLICAYMASRRMQPSARCAASHEFQKQVAFFALMSAARPPTSRRSLTRMFVATAINRSRVRRPLSRPVARWSKAGMPFMMCSTEKDTRTSLGTSAGSWRRCIHPGPNVNKSPWTSWPSKSRNAKAMSLGPGSLGLGSCVPRGDCGAG